MSVRSRLAATGVAVLAILSIGVVVPGATSGADPFPYPPLPCGPIRCPDPTPVVPPTVTYQEVNFHFDSINAGRGCGGNGDLGGVGGHGWCDGVYTGGHIAPFDGRARGEASWQGHEFTFSIDAGGAYVKGRIDDKASAVYTLTATSLLPSGAELFPRDRTSAPGAKGGPLHINIVEGSGIRKGLYHFYVHGWVGSFTRTTPTPPPAAPGSGNPLSGIFGSS